MRSALLLALLTPLRPAAAAAGNLNFNLNFGTALEECIRSVAKEVAAPQSSCMSPAERVDLQAEALARTLTTLHEAYGYGAAVWCAFYSARDTETETVVPTANELAAGLVPPKPITRSVYQHQYETILCPWDLTNCGDEPLGLNGDEWLGVPAEWGGALNNAAYADEVHSRQTMSCIAIWGSHPRLLLADRRMIGLLLTPAGAIS